MNKQVKPKQTKTEPGGSDLQQRGGRGYMQLANENRISPPPPAAVAAASAAAAATIALPALPIGKQPVAGLPAAQRLHSLYKELQHTEGLIYYVGMYLPKLAVNAELLAHKQQLLAEIATFNPGHQCSPPDLSPSTAKS